MEIKLKPFNKFVVTLLSFFIFCVGNAQIIDFDAVYTNDGDIYSKIQKAIEDAPVGATILFKSANYTINNGKLLALNKALTFEGLNPGNDFKSGERGASGIKTTITTKSNITIRSNNIKFKNIEFKRENMGEDVFDVLIDARHPSYLVKEPHNETQIQYTGLEFTNVSFNGTAYPFHAGNGIGATFTNVTIDNYRRIGFWTDRKGRLDTSKKITFDKCVFEPEAIIGFDDRAISLDAGNTEYPVVWDLEGTTVKNCKFTDAGIAISRCKNMIVTQSTFNDTKGKVDMAHVEEFSSNFTLSNNIFNCDNARTKLVVLDRELQIVSDIKISGNTITGSYGFFISAYAANRVSITANDLSKANSGNQNSIDFTFYENRGIEPIPFEILSHTIEISENKGLELPQNKNLKVDLLDTDTESVINDYLPAERNIRRLSEGQPLLPNGIYEIINTENNKKLCPATGNSLTTKSGDGDHLKWKITSNTPYTYIIQNVGNSEYMETAVPYTEFNIFNKTEENLFPNMFSYSADEENLPYWTIFKKGSTFNIFAGGNERQSALATNADEVKLLFGKVGNPDGTRSVKALGKNAKWTFNRVDGEIVVPKPVGNRNRSLSVDNLSDFIPEGKSIPVVDLKEVLDLGISYATGVAEGVEEELTYVAIEIRQKNESGETVNATEFNAVLLDDNPNASSIGIKFQIPENFKDGSPIPSTIDLPAGHELVLVTFISVNNDADFQSTESEIIIAKSGVLDRERKIEFSNKATFIPPTGTLPELMTGKAISLEINYATAITDGVEEDLNYVALQLRQIDETGDTVATTAFEIIVPDTAKNNDTVTINYPVPTNFTTGANNGVIFTEKIPTTDELPTGHKLLLLIFMQVDESLTGFADANTEIFVYDEKSKTLTTSDFKANEAPVTVYPNPVQDLLKIEGNYKSWKILNLLGNEINAGDTSEINVSNLSSGLYYLLLDKEKTILYKFIKK
ncbi:T9SS type A sorting domain-containing protein [Aquimarina agarivorans]|uniref:T9SS type A sorting domain-containing protein n=1 Tax=Aquimarina agarivorans TaxID=980584 RepID=UPI000248E635|nr:T9SS type A sorting domain-containing protein [Aquimarina agarivorans]